MTTTKRSTRSGVRDQITAIRDAVDELCRRGPRRHPGVPQRRAGDPRHRRRAGPAATCATPEILPLYARLSIGRAAPGVPAPHRGRRVVLATNVAETSLTVPGIKYVVDPGTARISRYSHRLKVQRLPIEPVSQASANQRKGRCGRTSDGICIRLYAEEDFLSRPGVHRPGDPAHQPRLGHPADDRARPRRHRRVPVHRPAGPAQHHRRRQPAAGAGRARRPAQAAHRRSAASWPSCRSTRGWPGWCSRPTATAASPRCMVIAAALSIQDPRERPVEHAAHADQLHARFADPDSDFVAYLNLWQLPAGAAAGAVVQPVPPDVQGRVPQLPAGPRVAGHRRAAAAGGRVARPGARPARRTDPARGCTRSLLAGLLSHIGLQGRREARVPRRPRRPVRDLPRLGAVQEAAALGDGGRAGRDLPAVGPGHRPDRAGVGRAARRPPGQAHLQRAALGEEAGARWWRYEQVTLYGVPIVVARKVNYGRIDPALSRELFIRHALVEGDWQTHHHVLRATTARCSTRSRSWRTGPAAATSSSTTRPCSTSTTSGSPPTSSPAGTSTRWWKKTRRDRPGPAHLRPASCWSTPAAATSTRTTIPDVWRPSRCALPLTYQFEPGRRATA